MQIFKSARYLLVVSVSALLLAACENAPPEVENVGINFAAMPVGTEAHYQNSRGSSWVEIYQGKDCLLYTSDAADD